MAISFYFDQHVPGHITEQLRRRGVDVLTVADDGWDRAADYEVLQRARELGRVVFTQDIGFKVLAEEWQRTGRSFNGLLFGHQQGGSIGEYVHELHIIAAASEPVDWLNVIERLPYPR